MTVVGTINVVSLVASMRKQWLLDLLLEKRIDLACVQETKIETREQEESTREFFKRHYQVFVSHSSGKSGGCAVFVRRKHFLRVCPDIGHDDCGRISYVDCILANTLIRVICLYAPNNMNERKSFFELINSVVDTPAKVILAGDFNCVESSEDRFPRRAQADNSVKVLRSVLKENNLIDVIELARPNNTQRYTHWQGDSSARLDRIYISDEFEFKDARYDVSPVPFSDHGLVTFEWRAGTSHLSTPHTSGHWKLNESLLEDDEFSTIIKEKLRLAAENSVFDAVSWEILKAEVKSEAMSYGERKAREKNLKKKELLHNLKTLIAADDSSPGNFREDIKAIKCELLTLMKERYMGAVVRSREKLVERDEQPSKLFQFFEKQRIKCNTIRQIRDENGQSFSTQEEIEDLFYEEYVRTFQKKDACDGRLAESMLQQLQKEVSEEVRERTNTEIVESEIRWAIRKMPSNKSPGPDGIGSAFYKKFLDQLAPLLQKVFKDIFKRKLLPPTMRQSPLGAHSQAAFRQ